MDFGFVINAGIRLFWLANQCFTSAGRCPKILVIVPVPLHRNRLRNRGFNQAQILAEVVSKKFGIPVASVLTRTKDTVPQFNLGRELRQDNVKDSFAVRSDLDTIKNKTIVLIDDVTTTGSTIGECAKVLKNNGAKEIWALVLAKA